MDDRIIAQIFAFFFTCSYFFYMLIFLLYTSLHRRSSSRCIHTIPFTKLIRSQIPFITIQIHSQKVHIYMIFGSLRILHLHTSLHGLSLSRRIHTIPFTKPIHSQIPFSTLQLHSQKTHIYVIFSRSMSKIYPIQLFRRKGKFWNRRKFILLM